MLLMVVAFFSVVVASPQYVGAAFNPFTLNLAMIVLAAIGYLAQVDIPSAGCTLRQPKE
jgi:hypothetical protein